MSCGEILAGIEGCPTVPLVAGVNDRLIVIYKPNILSITYDVTNKQLITDIALKVGKQGFVFEGKNDSIDPEQNLVKARYSTNWDHALVFRAFDNSPDVKDTVDLLKDGKYIAVVQNNHLGAAGNAAFDIYGTTGGLELMDANRLPADVETEASYMLDLRNNERAKEPFLPNSFFDTDFVTTKAKVDGLLIPAV